MADGYRIINQNKKSRSNRDSERSETIMRTTRTISLIMRRKNFDLEKINQIPLKPDRTWTGRENKRSIGGVEYRFDFFKRNNLEKSISQFLEKIIDYKEIFEELHKEGYDIELHLFFNEDKFIRFFYPQLFLKIL